LANEKASKLFDQYCDGNIFYLLTDIQCVHKKKAN